MEELEDNKHIIERQEKITKILNFVEINHPERLQDLKSILESKELRDQIIIELLINEFDNGFDLGKRVFGASNN